MREERDEAKLIHLRVFTAFPLPFLSALNNFVCSSSVFSLTSSLPQRFEFSQGEPLSFGDLMMTLLTMEQVP